MRRSLTSFTMKQMITTIMMMEMTISITIKQMATTIMREPMRKTLGAGSGSSRGQIGADETSATFPNSSRLHWCLTRPWYTPLKELSQIKG